MSIVIRVGAAGRVGITIRFGSSWASGGDLFVAIDGFPEDYCYHCYDKTMWRGSSLLGGYSLLSGFIFFTRVRYGFFLR